MSLVPGARFGPYEIQSALGAGGMGEVYRARDTRLKREVAVKLLPESAQISGDGVEIGAPVPLFRKQLAMFGPAAVQPATACRMTSAFS